MFDFFKKKQVISDEDKLFMQIFNDFYVTNKHLFNNISVDSSVSEKNKIIKQVYEKLGYCGIPKLLSEEQQKANDVDGKVVYRGISASTQEDLNSYVEQFVSGDMYLAGRGSIFGLGIYTYYGEDKQLLDNYSSNGGSDGYGQILEMILPNDCKIADIDKISKLQDYLANLYQKFSINKDDINYDIYVNKILSNPGCFAAILGYDAIKVPEKQYMVILNRSKVIVNTNMLSNDFNEEKRVK